MQDVAGRRCYVTFELIRVRQVIRPRSVPNVKTAGGSDDIVRNVVRHCSEFDIVLDLPLTTRKQKDAQILALSLISRDVFVRTND